MNKKQIQKIHKIASHQSTHNLQRNPTKYYTEREECRIIQSTNWAPDLRKGKKVLDDLEKATEDLEKKKWEQKKFLVMRDRLAA